MENITRQQAIDALVQNELDDIQQMAFKCDMTYIAEIMRQGFKGYDNFNNTSLSVEYEAQLGKQVKVTGKK